MLKRSVYVYVLFVHHYLHTHTAKAKLQTEREHNATVTALGKQGKWKEALEGFRSMQVCFEFISYKTCLANAVLIWNGIV
jgi:hypothetical protein